MAKGLHYLNAIQEVNRGAVADSVDLVSYGTTQGQSVNARQEASSNRVAGPKGAKVAKSVSSKSTSSSGKSSRTRRTGVQGEKASCRKNRV